MVLSTHEAKEVVHEFKANLGNLVKQTNKQKTSKKQQKQICICVWCVCSCGSAYVSVYFNMKTIGQH